MTLSQVVVPATPMLRRVPDDDQTASGSEPPAPAGGGPPPSRSAKTEPLARLALALAVAAVVLPPGAAAIAALVAAAKARRRIAASAVPVRGRGVVIAAMVLSVLAVVGWITVLAVVIADRATDDAGVDYSELEAGDCIQVPEGDDIGALERLPCDEPHDAEVFGVLVHPAEPNAPYPGSDALVAYAGESCLGQIFTDYMGVARDKSQLKHFEIVPQQSAWDDGRRQLVCAVDADAPLTGSVRGSAR